MKWLPWRTLVRRVAQSHGFLDPITLLAKLEQFAQPSGLVAPTELLRAGAVLQARGLINSQAIQHNLDWIWPFWVERQFDPNDPAFIPRAFNLTHINLSHRNWTALGVPGSRDYAIVDPRGLVTPIYDGWSLDAWIWSGSEYLLIPSQAPSAEQTWLSHDPPILRTTLAGKEARLSVLVQMDEIERVPVCRIRWAATSTRPAWLVVSLRPFNPEGVSFVDSVQVLPDRTGWRVNQKHRVYFKNEPERFGFSNYRSGDVARTLQRPDRRLRDEDRSGSEIAGECAVGLATAAALFPLGADEERIVEALVPAGEKKEDRRPSFELTSTAEQKWQASLRGACEMRIPDPHYEALFKTALRTLVLHAPDHDIYPGPFTYKRFWFRDAAYIARALLSVGLFDRVEPVLDRLPSRQTPAGHFLSQDGEWDSNGQALWMFRSYVELSGRDPKPGWRSSIARAVNWIRHKRLPAQPPSPHAGLLPPGFSAEHFGPSDYYYWDDFWSVEGIRSAAYLADCYGDRSSAQRWSDDAQKFMDLIEASVKMTSERVGKGLVPSSPYRRMDPAAIGSLAAGYPLNLWPARNERLLGTADFLLRTCCQSGAFYQEISHSGLNAYLTLHIAQVLLRAGDMRCHDLLRVVADLASPTGQWPEAIHPRTLGGCMGDGQHVWAAAEWILMLRNCLIREDNQSLILASGVPNAWLNEGAVIEFGPAPTAFGPAWLRMRSEGRQVQIEWRVDWRKKPDSIEIRIPGLEPAVIRPDQHSVSLVRP